MVIIPRSETSRFFHCAGLVLFAVVLLSLQGCGKTTIRSDAPVRYGPASGNNIVATARTQIGMPYKYGGTSPKTGFDCSGLILWSYEQYGVSVPRRAEDQAKFGQAIKKSQLRLGDIVIFRISSGLHTGIYSGNGRFIHSPSAGKKIREDEIDSDYWKRRYHSARRIL